MQRSGFRFFERLRVRWSEVDMQQIVFNGHYLTYFDTALSGYWRALVMPYHDTMRQLAGDLFVRKATVEYLGSAGYDQQCEVGLRCARIGNSSIDFVAALFRGEQLLVHAELVYVFADPVTQTSRPVPLALREVLDGFERGESMLDVRVGDWVALGAQAHTLRRAVFVDEQRIPAQLEEDGADAQAVHALALNRFGQGVATGRLLSIAPGRGKIGRMAVHAALRGSGVGQAMLSALVKVALERGDNEVMLNAQTSAVAFYLRNGFGCVGPLFEEAGIAHQTMRCVLPGDRTIAR